MLDGLCPLNGSNVKFPSFEEGEPKAGHGCPCHLHYKFHLSWWKCQWAHKTVYLAYSSDVVLCWQISTQQEFRKDISQDRKTIPILLDLYYVSRSSNATNQSFRGKTKMLFDCIISALLMSPWGAFQTHKEQNSSKMLRESWTTLLVQPACFFALRRR